MTLDEYLECHPEDEYPEPERTERQELLEEAYGQAETLASMLDRLHDCKPRKAIRQAMEKVYEIQLILEEEY